MPCPPFHLVLAHARWVAPALCARRGESRHETECDLLCALCVLFPSARLGSLMVSVDASDATGTPRPGYVGLETYAIALDGQWLDLAGVLQEAAWRAKALAVLREFLDRCALPFPALAAIRMQRGEDIAVDPDDPGIQEALHVLSPCHHAAIQAERLHQSTPAPAPDRPRRL